MSITPSEVRITPDHVRPGDVYLVVDDPSTEALVVVSGGEPGAPPNAPLPSGALERLARGDTELMTISGFGPGGCSPEQNAADRGKTGVCGNVMKLVVTTGIYAILAEPPEGSADSSPPPMAVLTVAP